MKSKNNKNTSLLIMFFMAIILVVFASASLAKYAFTFNQQMVGHYVDYRIAHDGEGRSAILETVNVTTSEDSSYQYDYVGYIVLSVTNVVDGQVSQRDIDFSLRTPTKDEIINGVADAWKNVYSVESTSKNYEVEIVNSQGNIMDTSSNEYKELTHFEERVEDTSSLNLTIRRRVNDKNGADVAELSSMEKITIVLETSTPYKDLQIFNIIVTNNLKMMSVHEDNYFGFEQVEVDIKTSKFYTISHNNSTMESLRPVKVELSVTNLTFDYERFILSVEGNYAELTDTNTFTNGYYFTRVNGVITKITLFIPAGSELKLYFYKVKPSGLSINATAVFDITSPSGSEDFEYTNYIAGITAGVVYTK